MIHLDYRDARPIYSQIADGIRQQIRAGILQEGDRLPSVREMAVELTINPNTIQRAYRELESEGIIASVAGKGSFVASEPAGNGELLTEFDALVEKLTGQGVTREELARRITEGGTGHAGI